MRFADLLAEQDMMTRGHSQLTVKHKSGTVAEIAQALEDQEQDLAFILSEMTEESLDDFCGGVDEAIRGLLEAVDRFDDLSACGKLMEDSSYPEAEKLANIIKALRGGYADIGRALKVLKVSSNQAHEANWED